MSVYEKLMAVANDPHATPAERAAYRAKAERIAERAKRRGFVSEGGKLVLAGTNLVVRQKAESNQSFYGYVAWSCATENTYCAVANISRQESDLVPV